MTIDLSDHASCLQTRVHSVQRKLSEAPLYSVSRNRRQHAESAYASGAVQPISPSVSLLRRRLVEPRLPVVLAGPADGQPFQGRWGKPQLAAGVGLGATDQYHRLSEG